MMKDILILISSLSSGGVSKSCVNLVNTFDRSRYHIELLLLDPSDNLFGEYLPQDLKIHTHQDIIDLHRGLTGLKSLLCRGKFFLFFGSIIRMCLSFVSKSWAGEWLAWLMPKFLTKEYDAIIDYNGQQQLYYMVNKLKGKKKITFFHSDYAKWDYYFRADKKYMPKVDAIFTISDVCVASLKTYFPKVKEKIYKMENISSPTLIRQMAEEKVELSQTAHLLVSIGHFSKNKGNDLSIEVAKQLKERGLAFKWIFIGKVLDEDLVKLIDQNELEDYMLLLGEKANPYPYIKAANLFVHLSKFEGKSIALDEAKILCKPIVVTNFSTVHDQFENRVNATIVSMNADAIRKAIVELLTNSSLSQQYRAYLSEHMNDNSTEIEKLYKIIG